MAGTVLPLCLLLLLQCGRPETPGPAARTGPVLRRLWVLEAQVGAPGGHRGSLGEDAPAGWTWAHPAGRLLHPAPLQFRRFQEVTLSHLQSIARNYNISYNIDRRFQVLAEQAEAADTAQAVLGAELARLAAASRRLHRRVKRLEGAVGALTPQHHLLTRPEGGAEPHSLWDTVRTQQEPRGSVPTSTASTQPLKVRQRPQEEGHRLLVETGTTGMPMEDTEPLRDAQAVAAALSDTATGPQEQLGTGRCWPQRGESVCVWGGVSSPSAGRRQSSAPFS